MSGMKAAVPPDAIVADLLRIMSSRCHGGWVCLNFYLANAFLMP